jgi:hypothetical protein
MPLVSVLPVLQPLLLAFAVVFSKPQQRHFDHYIQGLIVEDHRRTLAAMSRDVVGGPDASSWDRFVTTAPWELPALSTRWHQLLRHELRRLKPQGVRIAGRQTDFLIFDDTRHLRTGTALEGVGYHWDPVQQRACWSHSLVLGVYRTGDYTFGYSCDAYVRQREVVQLNAGRAQENRYHAPQEHRPSWRFRSKGELVVGQLQAFRPLREGRQTFLLVDSWYLNQAIVTTARAQQLDWCSTLRQNRNLTLVDLAPETGEVRQEWKVSVGDLLQAQLPAAMLGRGVPYAGAALTEAWRTFAVQGRTYRAVAYRARLAGIGMVQVVVAQERCQSGGWSPYVPLVTNRLDLTAAEVVRVHQERWAVEVLIRDGKQHLGLTDCQVERLEGTVRHWVLALLSQGMLSLLRLRADAGEVRTGSGRITGSIGRTLGEVRQFVKHCALVELIRWTCEQARAGRTAEEIAGLLGLPA